MNEWERQEYDTDKSYAAFCVYRDMGPFRSFDKTRQSLGKKRGYNKVLEKWSSNGDWVHRVKLYDEYVQAEAQRESEKALVEMQKRHANIALLMQNVVLQKVMSMTPEELNAFSATAMFKEAVKIERLARGLQNGPAPKERVEDRDEEMNRLGAGDQVVVYLPNNGRD